MRPRSRPQARRFGIEDCGRQRGFIRTAAAGLRRLAEAGRRADLVFLDPPYAQANEYALALNLLGGESGGLLAVEALVIAEHEKRHALDERYGRLLRYRVLKQGDAALSFYRTESG